MNTELLKNTILKALDDAKAKEVIILNVSSLTSISDYMIFCSGNSGRHVKSIGDYVIKASKEIKNKVLGIEGAEVGEWVLVDLGDIIVHIMQPEIRSFYQLEKLWSFNKELQLLNRTEQ